MCLPKERLLYLHSTSGSISLPRPRSSPMIKDTNPDIRTRGSTSVFAFNHPGLQVLLLIPKLNIDVSQCWDSLRPCDGNKRFICQLWQTVQVVVGVPSMKGEKDILQRQMRKRGRDFEALPLYMYWSVLLSCTQGGARDYSQRSLLEQPISESTR
jgi:hypothetical protein